LEDFPPQVILGLFIKLRKAYWPLVGRPGKEGKKNFWIKGFIRNYWLPSFLLKELGRAGNWKPLEIWLP